MHEALAYAGYEPDTEVAEEPRPVAVSRTVTDGALTMQVYTMGKWHRRTPDLAHTACGLPIDGQRNPVRREELAGDLCAGDESQHRDACFTGYELTLAALNNRKDQNP